LRAERERVRREADEYARGAVAWRRAAEISERSVEQLSVFVEQEEAKGARTSDLVSALRALVEAHRVEAAALRVVARLAAEQVDVVLGHTDAPA
jgi:hypothetical protein